MAVHPLTDESFARVMDALAPRGPWALAVSGGGDSVALLDLMGVYARRKGGAATALTVDHGLREGSAAEAQAVAALAAPRGIPHAILRWEGAKPRANLEARAREARYALMSQWCVAHGVSHLLLGHTLDDQAETFLIRLARGSGVDGLAAMAPSRMMAGVHLVRPLLDVPRAALRAHLAARGVAWCEDPMNADARFLRARMRAARAPLSALGLTPARLAATAKAMGRARAALEAATQRLMADAVTVYPEGYCEADLAALAAAPQEIGLRALARLVMSVGGRSYTPRLESLERLYAHLAAGTLGPGRTLSGCRIVPGAPGVARVTREAALVDAAPLALPAGAQRLWDGRFKVALAQGALKAGALAQVRPLGPCGRAALKAMGAAGAPGLPGAVKTTLPALWVNGRLAAVPHLGVEGAPGMLEAGTFHATFAGLARERI